MSTVAEAPHVLVVGTGNAAMSAALAAAGAGARVTTLEKASEDEAGGNTWYTAGAYRIPHDGLDDVLALLDDPDDPRLATTDLPPYPAEAFLADMRRLTGDRCDPDLTDVLVADARDALQWLRAHGVAFELMYHRQAYEHDGRLRFWGGLAVGVVGGGKALVAAQAAAARALGVTIVYGAGAARLVQTADGTVTGVETTAGDLVGADAVVLACGGFQADAARRAEHLGPRWRDAKVRGTRHNTGDGHDMALAAGAARAGDWTTCHAVAWDVDAPPTGDRELTNRLTKQSYPLGLVVNAGGERFIDEGADFRNYTYAKLGRAIIEQPGGRAFQLFDAPLLPLLREEEYGVPCIRRTEAPTIDALARGAGIDPDGLRRTIEDYNNAVQDGPFDPTRKDGKATVGLTPPKSNWAQPLTEPPFVAVEVTCGITFTFGGLRADVDGRVLTQAGTPIPGLLAAGELVGGLFAGNYPGGSGLAAGTVFGRRAGLVAAAADTPLLPTRPHPTRGGPR